MILLIRNSQRPLLDLEKAAFVLVRISQTTVFQIGTANDSVDAESTKAMLRITKATIVLVWDLQTMLLKFEKEMILFIRISQKQIFCIAKQRWCLSRKPGFPKLKKQWICCAEFT